MGYFKKRREAKDAQKFQVLIDLFVAQAVGTQKAVTEGVLDAINIFDDKKYQYENNVRENLEAMLLNPVAAERLVQEVANVIETGMELYSYRIAKGKREELAQDILVALSVKK